MLGSKGLMACGLLLGSPRIQFGMLGKKPAGDGSSTDGCRDMIMGDSSLGAAPAMGGPWFRAGGPKSLLCGLMLCCWMGWNTPGASIEMPSGAVGGPIDGGGAT